MSTFIVKCACCGEPTSESFYCLYCQRTGEEVYEVQEAPHTGKEGIEVRAEREWINPNCPECFGTGIIELGGTYIDGEPGPIERVACIRCEELEATIAGMA